MISLETCWAVKEQWNNKLSYTVASCWSFLQDLNYDARIHEREVPHTTFYANTKTGFDPNLSILKAYKLEIHILTVWQERIAGYITMIEEITARISWVDIRENDRDSWREYTNT